MRKGVPFKSVAKSCTLLSMPSLRDTLVPLYDAMAAHFGPCRWWPGETPFEIAVGAVLTQNTAWRNVEKALARLKAGGPLTPARLLAMPTPALEEAIRPSGFYRLKAARLRNLLEFMASFPGFAACAQPPPRHHGSTHPLSADGADLAFMQCRDTQTLRNELLAVKGIGPETADCILLYALGRPSFVVDTYTRRLVVRHGLLPPGVPPTLQYDELRDFFMKALPLDVPLFNEYHALIVRTGSGFCKKNRPLCHACPLGHFLDNVP